MAARPPSLGAIHGVVIDSTTGKVKFFDGTLSIDVFNLATMQRTREFMSPASVGSEYEFTGFTAGDYKLRFRWWDEAGLLARYRWWNDKANFDVATVITVPPGGSAEADATLKPMRGARVSGTLVERGTGVPLTSGCYSIHLYEASGIDMGWIIPVDDFGRWHTYKLAPAGRWTALARYTTGQFDPRSTADGIIDPDCGTSPAHLDTWYHGASGWPLFLNSLVAHGATFHSAATFGVAPGVPVDNIDIEMLPAPTGRGKAPTIFGTTLADEIVGTAGRDIISGLAGSDWIAGRAGNDLICGDAGNDNIDAGAGLKDIVDGGSRPGRHLPQRRAGLPLRAPLGVVNPPPAPRFGPGGRSRSRQTDPRQLSHLTLAISHRRQTSEPSPPLR